MTNVCKTSSIPTNSGYLVAVTRKLLNSWRSLEDF